MKAHFIAVCSKQSLPKIRAFVEAELRAMNVQDDTTHQLVLAVDEACANSIIHQHDCDGKSRIRLTISRKGNKLHFDLEDNGAPFPIEKYQPEELKEMIRRRHKGGLGIYLITQIMDEIQLIPAGQNHVYRFTKFL